MGHNNNKNNKIDIADKLKVNKDEIAVSIFNKVSIKNVIAERINPNVAFIILESFGELPILYNSDNFNILVELKRHFSDDVGLYNFLISGIITVHCLESTVL